MHKKEDKYITAVVSVIAIIFVGWLLVNRFGGIGGKEVTTVQITEEIKTLADGTKYLVHPDKLLSGGPPKGGIGVERGIPAIADPKFISAEEAKEWLNDDALVFGIDFDGVVKAYPKQILVFHEIVNDFANDKPVLITYCPLCGTGIAFERTIDGEAVRFGTSGKLLNSNLVMYDEKTDSYWTQVGGRAIVGELTGIKLKQIPIDTMLWKDWKELHSDTLVLSKDTGFSSRYQNLYTPNADPYAGYYYGDLIGFGVKFNDTRLHPKRMVAGITIGDITKAYPVSEVDKVGLVNDVVGGVNLLVAKDPKIDIKGGFEINPLRVYDRKIDGKILEFELKDGKLFDKETGSEWNFDGDGIVGEFKNKKLKRIDSESSMWFSWLAFNPSTELFLA